MQHCCCCNCSHNMNALVNFCDFSSTSHLHAPPTLCNAHIFSVTIFVGVYGFMYLYVCVCLHMLSVRGKGKLLIFISRFALNWVYDSAKVLRTHALTLANFCLHFANFVKVERCWVGGWLRAFDLARFNDYVRQLHVCGCVMNIIHTYHIYKYLCISYARTYVCFCLLAV